MKASKSNRWRACAVRRSAAESSVRSSSRSAALWITPKPLTSLVPGLSRRRERVAAEVEVGQLGHVGGGHGGDRQHHQAVDVRQQVGEQQPRAPLGSVRPGSRIHIRVTASSGKRWPSRSSTLPLPGRPRTQTCSGRDACSSSEATSTDTSVAPPCGTTTATVDGVVRGAVPRRDGLLADGLELCARSTAGAGGAPSWRRRSASATSSAVSSRHSA